MLYLDVWPCWYVSIGIGLRFDEYPIKNVLNLVSPWLFLCIYKYICSEYICLKKYLVLRVSNSNIKRWSWKYWEWHKSLSWPLWHKKAKKICSSFYLFFIFFLFFCSTYFWLDGHTKWLYWLGSTCLKVLMAGWEEKWAKKG